MKILRSMSHVGHRVAHCRGLQEGRILVDGWLDMNAPAQTAVLFKELRKKLDAFLVGKIDRKKSSAAAINKELMETLARLLIDEDKPAI